MVAAARQIDVLDVPMLQEDAEAIVAETLRLQAVTGTRQELRAHPHKKRRADHMVAAAQERRTKRKMDEKRTERAQKEAERVAERMGGRGALASSQSTRSRKPNQKDFAPEFQWAVLLNICQEILLQMCFGALALFHVRAVCNCASIGGWMTCS